MLNANLRFQALTGRLLKQNLGPHLLALIATTEQGLFAVDPEDRVVGRQLLHQGSYGRDELERLEPLVSADANVLVIGAHLGSLVVPLSKRCREVVAFEANPATYRLLEINLLLNQVTNCRALNLAVNDEEGTIEFLLSRANSGGSKRVPLIKKAMYYYDKPETIAVKAVRLDDYLEHNGFDLVVMDIEGSEYFALQGMQRILKGSRVLAVEFLPHHLKNVSGATVQQLLGLVEPHFSTLTIPSKGVRVERAAFQRTLQTMYDKDESDDGIIFEK
jgi:FkbM family methyltransferase